MLVVPDCLLTEEDYEYYVLMGEINEYELLKDFIAREFGELASKVEYEFLNWFLENESNIVWHPNGTTDYFSMYYNWRGKCELKKL